MHHPTDRIARTTDYVTPVVDHWMEREEAQWVHPMKDRSDDPSHHERTLLPQSYISLLRTIWILSYPQRKLYPNYYSQLTECCKLELVAKILQLFIHEGEIILNSS